jgi:hypothetical protein
LVRVGTASLSRRPLGTTRLEVASTADWSGWGSPEVADPNLAAWGAGSDRSAASLRSLLIFFPIGIRRLRPSVSLSGPPPRVCWFKKPSKQITRGRPDRWYLIAASGSQGLGIRAAQPRPETICGSQRTRVDSGRFVSTGVSTKLGNFEKPQ